MNLLKEIDTLLEEIMVSNPDKRIMDMRLKIAAEIREYEIFLKQLAKR